MKSALALCMLVTIGSVCYCAGAPNIQTFDKDFRVFLSKANEPKGDFSGKIWVVLVAGSQYYYNYRHQVSFHSLFSQNSVYMILFKHTN